MDRFRSSSQFLDHSSLKEEQEDVLRMSGSNEIIFRELHHRLKAVDGPIYILDLTPGHIQYYWEIPLRHFEYKKHKNKIFPTLRRLLLMQSLGINHQNLETEENLSRKYGFNYVNFFVNTQTVPSPEETDRLILFINQLPQKSWVHVHCNKGKGRTTVVMVMIDILKNGKKLSLQKIVDRQHKMGGVDLFDTTVWYKGTYTQEQLENRKNFVTAFYNYINDDKGYMRISWTQWCKEKNIHYHYL